ncbi:calcium-binding protein [Chelatococcus sambhunathii]|uniref:Calcium-binding protein n=1 Tax=Chelatococcus sambhunathii TaxID=363953 RepID=A0ABU1DDY1_9HYPH|nr:calcium-binding protein [Chelatococcus sambhunathii]MDR4306287.1 calcium-binding protein [Chelatococcus sambhunathii]
MALLGLKLGHIVDDVFDTLDHILGKDLSTDVGDLVPGKLIESLGKSLDGLLTGGSHDLLDDLLSNDVLDVNLLNNILSGKTLDLGDLEGLLSGATNSLGDILDDVFDDGLLGIGGTSLNVEELLNLNGSQLGDVTTFVTSLIGTILKATGGVADIDEVLDSVLSGDDKLRGDGKDNEIDGHRGDDTIYGVGGDDTLIGSQGEDVLKGGSGDDHLVGGADVDVMYGGKGADIFVFSEDDTGIGPGQRDLIKDFGKGGDELAFKGFGEDFDFIGKHGFSGDGHAEISWKFKGDYTLVKGDVDGDGQADFAIEIAGKHHLSSSDFIL